MIGRLQGKILEKAATQVLIDVQGVGYEVEIPLSTYALIANAQEVALHTHMVVREDAQQLFGFATKAERELFRALIKVNRVGPKLALAILSGMEGNALAECVQNNDVKALAGLPGVGKKTAERMIIDLRDSLPALGFVASGTRPATPAGNLADAETALIGLGFKPQEAALALAKVPDPEADIETLIKAALKALG